VPEDGPLVVLPLAIEVKESYCDDEFVTRCRRRNIARGAAGGSHRVTGSSSRSALERTHTAVNAIAIAVAAVASLVLAMPGGAVQRSFVTPTITITRATITPTSVDLRMRFCTIVGPGARIVTIETRRLNGRVRGRVRGIEPLGVDLDRDYPYQCVGYMIKWLREPQVRGPGVYTVALFVEDSHGRKSRTVSLRLAN
jgi:hypothetical protein